MHITIHNNKSPAEHANGRYYKVFTPRSAHDVLRIHHDADCIGDTQLKKIQIEQGTKPTAFENPQETTRPLTGLFADLRALNIELSDTNSEFWGKIRANNNGMLIEYYNSKIKTELAAVAEGVTSRITNTINGDYSSFDQRLNALQIQIKNAAVASTVQQLADKYTRQIAAIDGRVSTVQQKADSLATQIVDANNNISTVRQTVTGLQTQLKDTDKNVSAVQQTAKSLQTQITSANGDISNVKQTATLLGSQLKSATGDISKLQQTATSLAAELKDSKGNYTRLFTTVNGMQSDISSAAGDISTVRRTVNTLTSQISTSDGKLSTLKQTVDGLTSSLSTTNGNYSTLKQTVDRLSSTIRSQGGDYSALVQDVDGLKTTVKSHTGAISSLQIKAGSLESKVSGLDGTISSVRQDYNSLTSRITTAQNSADAAADKASEVKQTVNSLTSTIGDRYGRRTTLTQDIDSIRSKVSTNEYNYSSIKQTVDSINVDVNSLKNRSSVSVTDKGIVLASGEVIDGDKLASMIAVSPSGVRLIGSRIGVTGSMIVDGSIVARHISSGIVSAGHLQAGAVHATHIASQAVTASKIYADEAFFKLFSANTAFLKTIYTHELFGQYAKLHHAAITQADINTIVANQAFINAIDARKIKASQIDTDSLRGKTIVGATLQGNTKIQIGKYGFLSPVEDGLHINAPEYYGATKGVGVQILGKQDGKAPKGVFIYNDPNFNNGDTIETDTDEILLSVKGRIECVSKHDGKLLQATPVLTNSKYGNYVKGLHPICFIGWDQEAQDGSGGIYFQDGTGSNGTWWLYPDSYSSDRRLKENVQETSHSALALVQQLQFYEFDWKPNAYGKRKPHTRIGLLADELQQLDSTLVYEEGNDHIKNIDAFRLLNVAVKAIQELHIKIQQLEARLS